MRTITLLLAVGGLNAKIVVKAAASALRESPGALHLIFDQSLLHL